MKFLLCILLFLNLRMIDFSLSHPVMTPNQGASPVLMQWKMNKGKYDLSRI